MEKRHRVFIAINLPEEIKKELVNFYDKWSAFIDHSYDDISTSRFEFYVNKNSIKLFDKKDDKNDHGNSNYSYYFCLLTIDNGKDVCHANAIIIDNKRMTITRFEPHGARTRIYDYVNLEKLLKQVFHEKFSDYIYISPWSYQAYNGPQTYETLVKDEYAGFCLAWSLRFMHLRAIYRDVSYAKLDKIILMEEIGPLGHQIRAYTTFFNSLSNNLRQCKTRSFIQRQRY